MLCVSKRASTSVCRINARADKTKRQIVCSYGFPNVVGCIDGTQVQIQAPNEQKHEFVNRKGYHAINGSSTMTQAEYKLFEGPVDFVKFVFAEKAGNDGTPVRPECWDHPLQKTSYPRPIVKTHHCINTVSISTSDLTYETTSVGETVPHSGQRSPGERGHLRSLSCSSGGSDGGGVFCVFCKRNGETREYYSTHTLKDWRGLIVCPVLRAYTCPKCGATGDHAHTESHCPQSRRQPSIMASLRTRRSSCGIRIKHPSCKP